MQRIGITTLLGVMLLAGSVSAQPTKRQEIDLQAAIRTESVHGDLKGAIKQYNAIVSKFGKTDHSVAARALVRMGQCYEKLGDAEARNAYERVVREFGDQKDVVETARVRLAALGGAKSGISYRQAWADSKLDTQATVSPDGRYLTFVDSETGDLALHDFTTGADRRLTNKGSWTESGEFALASAISKDGRRVAYSWYTKERPDELRIADLPASGFLQPRRLVESQDVASVTPYDWSPDAKWLAVRVARKNGACEIGFVSTLDGSLRVKPCRSMFPERLFFSPDGRHVGFDMPGGPNRNREVWAMAMDGGAETEVVATPGQNIMMGWSPDGKRLLFASDRSGGMDLWAVSIADWKPQGSPELLRPDLPPISLGMTVSGALFVQAAVSNADLYVASIDFETGKATAPRSKPVQSFVGSNTQPVWSPDGKHLAYVSARSRMGGDRVLAIRSVETGQVRELRPSLMAFSFPRWAPDGRSFVTFGVDFSGTRGIYRLDARTGAATAITTGQMVHSPQVSPDGRNLYFLRVLQMTGEYVLVERDLTSGNERTVMQSKSTLGAPAVSPDGRMIAIRAFNTQALLLVPTDGGEPRELLRVNSPQSLGWLLTWTPDGRHILASTNYDPRGDKRELWLIPSGGGARRKLDIDAYRLATPVSIHPDGKRMAYVQGEQKWEVWVLENFLPAEGRGK